MADKYLDSIERAAKAEALKQTENTVRRYEEISNANAADAAISRSRLQQAMSGAELNATQNTAMRLAHGTSNAAARAQRESAVAELEAEISKLEADWLAQRRTAEAEAYRSSATADQELKEYKFNKSKSVNASIYDTDTEAKLLREKLAQQILIAQIEAALEREKLKETKNQANLDLKLSKRKLAEDKRSTKASMGK